MTLGLIMFSTTTAILLALHEIQIEGEDGWAKNLPTWRIYNPLKTIISWPYITGYHIYLWLLLLLLFQLPFFFNTPLTLKNEILVIEILYVMLILEDFFWFILNPKWGIRRFLNNTIPWHSKKFIKIPVNYWAALVVFLILDRISNIL